MSAVGLVHGTVDAAPAAADGAREGEEPEPV